MNEIYVAGDVIPNLGKVKVNHCGLPWVATVDGNMLFGCVTIENTDGLFDAIDGHKLTEEEITIRKGNKEFDYDNRFEKQNRPQREIDYISQHVSEISQIYHPTFLGTIKSFFKN